MAPATLLLRSPAFPRNHQPIQEVLAPLMATLHPVSLLELAAGPGEHAVHYAAAFPAVRWQPTDAAPDAVASTNLRRERAGLVNLLPAVEFDVLGPVPSSLVAQTFGAALAINFLHMVPMATVATTFAHLGRLLAPGAVVVIYDCFRFDAEPLCESNIAFHSHLQAIGGGVHEYTAVNAAAEIAGFSFAERHNMPANNQMMVWRRLMA